jgi:type I restriction enzyme S subunit
MMGKYVPYPEYKTSYVEGVRKLPVGWAIKRVRFILKAGYDGLKIGPFGSQLRSEMLTTSGYKVYGQENVIGRDFSLGERYIDQEKFGELNVYKISPGDVLITMMGSSGNCEIVPETFDVGIMDSHLIRLRVRDSEVANRFFRLLIDSAHYVKYQIRLLGKGSIMHGLNSAVIKELQLVLPPRKEQTQILGFIDHETTKIDRLIAKQERLIELLKEKRQAVISHAVTKGLNPDAPTKDSGVEWLGEVPAHWGVARVKFVAKLESGHTPSKQVEEYWVDCDIPWVSLNDSRQLAQVDYISDTAYKVNHKGIAGSSARLLPAGAVVFTRDATIGLSAITTREMAVSQHLIAWLPREQISSLFLLRVFNAMKDELDRFTFGATIKTIGMDDVKSLTTTVPPIDEQELICKHIDVRLAKFDLLIQKAEQQISLQKEHRTALISATVTGKIDVRCWQKSATEPEEATAAASA